MNFQKTDESKAIWYKDELKTFEVYLIPLSALIYNKLNGRIKSSVMSYESGIGRSLDPKDSNDRHIIENYLFESAENRNEKTLDSLRNYGQQEIGIVTHDLIIIDGNRRASLLSKLHREGSKIDFFKAIILPDNLSDNPVEIIKLETNYQMGVDNKVEYKPIEKYLRCKELISEYEISIEEVAKLMAEKTTRISQWMSILSLMEEYLIYLNSPNVYTRLDKKEGHFVDLNNYLKHYHNSNQLKEVYFDFIRLGIPVQRARIIGNPKDNQSVFSNQDLWVSFYQYHKLIKDSFVEKSFPQMKQENPELSNEQIFVNIDNYFREKNSPAFLENLTQIEIAIKELRIRSNIKNELQKINSYLIKINKLEIADSDKHEIRDLLDSILSQLKIIETKI